jgi:hypothetical protein
MFLNETSGAIIWQPHFTNTQYWSVFYRNGSITKKLRLNLLMQLFHAKNCLWVANVAV